MKHLKMLSLAAVAALGLMAIVGAGGASAAVLCKTNTNPCTSKWSNGTELDFSLASGTSASWKATGGTVLKTCTTGRVRGKITSEGSESEAVRIELSEFSWSSCTVPTVTKNLGELEINSIAESTNGTVTLKNSEFTTEDVIFGDCSYGTGAGVHLGALTSSSTGDAVMHVNAVLGPIGGPCCPDVVWVEQFTLTSPQETPLYVKPS